MLTWYAEVYFCMQYEITVEFAYNGKRLMSYVLACRHIPSSAAHQFVNIITAL